MGKRVIPRFAPERDSGFRLILPHPGLAPPASDGVESASPRRMKAIHLRGLVAATHAPFEADGSLNLPMVERQAAHLLAAGVTQVFVNGTTGECASLSLAERLALAERWLAVAAGTPLRVIVHVGANALPDARQLAAHARENGALAVSAFAPSYFKPGSVSSLVEWCAEIAAAAPGLPFFYYDIPLMTGAALPMGEFLERAAERIPNLGGLKFTNHDLLQFQHCLRAVGGGLSVPWGCDEFLLAALALGGTSAVGSTYNFAAPVYQRLWRAFDEGRLVEARAEQFKSAQLVAVLNRHGYMAASKAVMTMLGVDVGPPRLPVDRLSPEDIRSLERDLVKLGFFEWIRQTRPAPAA